MSASTGLSHAFELLDFSEVGKTSEHEVCSRQPFLAVKLTDVLRRGLREPTVASATRNTWLIDTLIQISETLDGVLRGGTVTNVWGY